MSGLEQTSAVRDTSRNIQGFITDHMDEFWALVRYVIPYVVAIHLINGLVPVFLLGSLAYGSLIFAEISGASLVTITIFFNVLIMASIGYLFAVIAVSWHRLVINGADNDERMSIFRPKRHEILFVVTLAVLNMIMYGLFFAGMHATAYMAPYFIPESSGSSPRLVAFFLFVPVFIGSIISLFLFFKCCFLFPARAVNHVLSISDSFRMTKGYFWKIIWTYIRASFKTFVFLVICLVLLMIVMYFGLLFLSSLDNLDFSKMLYVTSFVSLLANLPFLIFFQPMFLVIGVTLISNYYLYALEQQEKKL